MRDEIKGLFADLLDLDNNKKENTKAINEFLEKDPKFKILKETQVALTKQINEYKELKLYELVTSNKNIDENKKLIKDDIDELLKPNKKKLIGDIYKYYKVRYEKGEDELQEVTNKFIEVFDS